MIMMQKGVGIISHQRSFLEMLQRKKMHLSLKEKNKGQKAPQTRQFRTDFQRHTCFTRMLLHTPSQDFLIQKQSFQFNILNRFCFPGFVQSSVQYTYANTYHFLLQGVLQINCKIFLCCMKKNFLSLNTQLQLHLIHASTFLQRYNEQSHLSYLSSVTHNFLDFPLLCHLFPSMKRSHLSYFLLPKLFHIHEFQ